MHLAQDCLISIVSCKPPTNLHALRPRDLPLCGDVLELESGTVCFAESYESLSAGVIWPDRALPESYA